MPSEGQQRLVELLQSEDLDEYSDALISQGFKTVKSLGYLTGESLERMSIQQEYPKRRLLALAEEVTGERSAKRPRLNNLAVGPAEPADPRFHVVFPFEDLDWAAKTLQKLVREDRVLTVLHGPYSCGKTSILRWIQEELQAQPNVVVALVHGDMIVGRQEEAVDPAEFWRRMGQALLDDPTVGSYRDMFYRLSETYAGRRWYFIVDEMTVLVSNQGARSQFLDFMTLLSGYSEASKFFGGFLGAGTLVASNLLRSPPITAAPTPQEAEPSGGQSHTAGLAQSLQRALLDSSRYRSPFQSGTHIAVGTLSLDQSLHYLEMAVKAAWLEVDDDVKSDIHFFTFGNIGLVSSCASLLCQHAPSNRHITMVEWQKIKLFHAESHLTRWNRMTWRITNTFHTSSDEMKQLILDLLVHEGPRVLQEREEDAGETLIEMGIATRGATGAILLSSPYMRMLLLRLAYPMKRISGITVPKLDDLSIDGLKLLQLALEYVAKAVISAPYSMNRNGPSEAVIQAELYSVFKAIGESTGDFKVFVEVKEKPGAAMRLDLMLVDVHGNPIVGYELKVGLLRATDIVSAVRDQAEKYRKDHRLPQMYLVNFVADTSGLDRNLPGRVGNVDCVVFRYSAGFQQLRREPPAVTSAAPSAADTQILYEVKGRKSETQCSYS